MGANHSSLPRRLPVIPPAEPDELLSSWLKRIAKVYVVRPHDLLAHIGLSSPSVERRDHDLSLAQAIVISGFVNRAPDDITRMTHTRLTQDCRPFLQSQRLHQRCPTCTMRQADTKASGAILRSWMQGWRISCRACGSRLTDIAPRAPGGDDAIPDNILTDAHEGQHLFESYATGTTAFDLSPVTMFTLLTRRRIPDGLEFRLDPGRPYRVISLFVDYAELAGGQSINGILGKVGAYPMPVRSALLAGLARAMRAPLETIELLRSYKIISLRDLLEQDPFWGPRSQLGQLT